MTYDENAPDYVSSLCLYYGIIADSGDTLQCTLEQPQQGRLGGGAKGV